MVAESRAPRAESTPARRGAALGAAGLLAAYLLTLAPGVTLWDAGEFIAAMQGFGIPHPPGTPLYVALGRAWTAALAPLGTARAANLLSAVATVLAVGLLATVAARRLGAAAAMAAAFAAGAMASVWRSATETEVYAAALLLAMATLVAAERAGRTRDARWALAVAYGFGLALPLHQFALVGAPAALLLACTADDGAVDWPRALGLTGALLLAVGGGTARPPLALVGVAVAAVGSALALRRRRRAGEGTGAWAIGAMLLLALLGLSALAILPLRAAFDPAINQGNPARWPELVDLLARRQYAVAPLWPRQAPLWLQLGNVIEYADWQVALGLAPGPAPAWVRTPFTVLFAALGAYGSLVHRAADRRTWRAVLVLLAAASAGVVLYLNLKAGPSFGAGVLPPGAAREARERDYFFVFAFLAWGAWTGVGAWAAAQRWLGGRGWIGVAVAALPLALNARAVDRARGPESVLARDVAVALLAGAPRDAVLLTAGDNDSYPLWYLQEVEGVRRDVQVVVTSLLPADWYRDELAHRAALGARVPRGAPWPGLRTVLATLDSASRAGGRPLATTALVTRDVRAQLPGTWVLRGVLYTRSPGGWPAADDTSGVPPVDTAAARRIAPLVRRQLGTDGLPLPSAEAAARVTRRLLACAEMAAAAPTSRTRPLLASWCNRR